MTQPFGRGGLAIGDETCGFHDDWIEPGSGRANKGTVMIEITGGKITRWVDDGGLRMSR